MQGGPSSVQSRLKVGDPVELEVRGESVRVGTAPVEVPVDGQGPRIEGGPAPHQGGESPSRRAPEPDAGHEPGPTTDRGLEHSPGVVPHSWSHELDDPTGPIPVRRPDTR